MGGKWMTADFTAGGRGQFPPGTSLNVLLLSKWRNSWLVKKSKSPLAPAAPKCRAREWRLHFIVGKGQMNDEFGDAGLKIFSAPFL